MEDVLEVCQRPYDPARPQVCLDEAAKQLLGEVRGHPFLGLFGGGPKMVRSALQVSTGWPILASTIFAGVLSEELQAEVPCPMNSEWLLTQRLYFRRIDDAIRFTDGHAQTVVRDFGPEVTRWIESVAEVRRARANAPGKTSKAKARRAASAASTEEASGPTAEATDDAPPPSRLQLQGFNAIEFIVPGTRFTYMARLASAILASGARRHYFSAPSWKSRARRRTW